MNKSLLDDNIARTELQINVLVTIEGLLGFVLGLHFYRHQLRITTIKALVGLTVKELGQELTELEQHRSKSDHV